MKPGHWPGERRRRLGDAADVRDCGLAGRFDGATVSALRDTPGALLSRAQLEPHQPRSHELAQIRSGPRSPCPPARPICPARRTINVTKIADFAGVFRGVTCRKDNGDEPRGHALRAHQTSTRGHRLPRGARSRRQGGAGEGSALEPRRMGAASASARSGQGARGSGQEPCPRAGADPLRADARLAVHVLSRRGGDHGDGPREDPESGLRVQACGDAHLSNFGVFAAPDRSLVLDVNDFDETLPGPGSGTSSALRRASRSPGATATSPRRRPALRSSARSAPTARRCASSPRCGTSTSGTRASTSTPCSPTWPRSPTASR